jgi:hypothetical protein
MNKMKRKRTTRKLKGGWQTPEKLESLSKSIPIRTQYGKKKLKKTYKNKRRKKNKSKSRKRKNIKKIIKRKKKSRKRRKRVR